MSEKIPNNESVGKRIQSSLENPLTETPTPSAINNHWASSGGTIYFDANSFFKGPGRVFSPVRDLRSIIDQVLDKKVSITNYGADNNAFKGFYNSYSDLDAWTKSGGSIQNFWGNTSVNYKGEIGYISENSVFVNLSAKPFPENYDFQDVKAGGFTESLRKLGNFSAFVQTGVWEAPTVNIVFTDYRKPFQGLITREKEILVPVEPFVTLEQYEVTKYTFEPFPQGPSPGTLGLMPGDPRGTDIYGGPGPSAPYNGGKTLYGDLDGRSSATTSPSPSPYNGGKSLYGDLNGRVPASRYPGDNLPMPGDPRYNGPLSLNPDAPRSATNPEANSNRTSVPRAPVNSEDSPSERGPGPGVTPTNRQSTPAPAPYNGGKTLYGSYDRGGSSNRGYAGRGDDTPSERGPGPGVTRSSRRGYSGYGGEDSPSERARSSRSSSYNGGKSLYGGYGKPVLLDLDNNGLKITEQQSSNTWFDMAGDGKLHQTAWVGKGDGVLAIDSNGDGKITERNEIVFTEWDPGSNSDLEAIRHVFDTNDNGRLDAGDARFGEFRVLVDGQVKTLAQVAIASIDLTAKGTGITYSGGSGITGTTTFTRTDNTTGLVGDAVLLSDATGYRLIDATVTNADGSKTRSVKEVRDDGSIATESRATTSADGKRQVIQYDGDGDGIFDNSKDITWATAANGAETRTTLRKRNDGSIESREILTTSADGRAQTLGLDNNGDGTIDNSQTFVRNTDGSSSTTTTKLSVNGSNLGATTVSASTNGLTKTTDQNISGAAANLDYRTIDTTVIAADGSRTQTIESRSRNNTLLSRSVTTTSANGLTTTVASDLNGDGTTDATTTKTIVAQTGGGFETTTIVKNGNGTTRAQQIVTKSANGLVTETKSDPTGSSTYSRNVDATVINADGSRTRTVSDYSISGVLLARSIKTTSADGKTINQTLDADGDGDIDSRATVVPNANGTSTTTTFAYNNNQSLDSKSVTVTSADGLTQTTQVDSDGNGDYELTKSDATVANANGSRTQTLRTLNEDGSLHDETVTTTSADGLTVSSTSKLYLAGAITSQSGSQTVITLAADGTRTETSSALRGDGTTALRTISILSPDRLTETVKSDINADGNFEKIATTVTKANGDIETTVSTYAPNGTTLISRAVSMTTGNGLSTTATIDRDGNGTVDGRSTDVTVINANGSRTRTETSFAPNGTTILNCTITTTSGNGLWISSQVDANGDGKISKVTDSTYLSANGSKSRTATTFAPDGTTIVGRIVKTTSDDGLTVTTTNDQDGNGTVDIRTVAEAVLNTNGSKRTTASRYNANNALLSRQIDTTSADGRTITQTFDRNGDAVNDRTVVTAIQADGSTIVTSSDFKPDGTLRNRTQITTSANELTKTSRMDADGDGTYELRIVDAVVQTVTGSQVQTTSRYNAADVLLERSVKTVSADGLTTSIASDPTGAGTNTRTTTDVVSIANSGVRTRTISDRNAANTLLRSVSDVTSADLLTRTISTDLDGNGVNDQTVVTSLQTDGSSIVTASDFTAAGVLKARATTTASTNGLTVTTVRDIDGNGTTDVIDKVEIVRNADGSATTTSSHSSGANVLLDKVIQTVSADGLTTVRTIDTDANNTADRTETLGIVKNLDGSEVRTSTTTLLGVTGTFTSATETSASGLVVTRRKDTDGNGSVDQTETDTTVLNADGSTTRTVEARTSANVLLSKSETTVSADQLTTTVKSDPMGTGAYTNVLVTSTRQDGDGRTVQTFTNSTLGGIVKDSAVVTTSADGRLKSIRRDANGDGFVDQVETTELKLDGTVVTTVADFNNVGVLQSQVVKTKSFDGLTETSLYDLDGDGANDRTRTELKVVNADGSTTSTLTDLDTEAYVATLGVEGNSSTRIRVNGGVLFQKSTLSTSADGRTVTLVKDADGDGVNDFNETTVTDAVGNTVTTTSKTEKIRDTANVVHTQVTNSVTKVNAGGLNIGAIAVDKSETKTITYDGVVKPTTTETTTVRIDGSLVVTKTDSLNGNSFKTISADGQTSTEIQDVPSSSAKITKTTQLLNDGSKIETVSTPNPVGKHPTNAAITGRLDTITRTSANGVSKSVERVFYAGTATVATFADLTVTGNGMDVAVSNLNQTVSVKGSRNAIVSGNGNDTLSVDGKWNSLVLGTGANTVTLASGNGGNTISGAGASDAVSYAPAGAGVTVRPASGQALGSANPVDVLAGIETITGSAYADDIVADAGNNSVSGGAGNDTLTGGAGNDTLVGGAGNDSYVVDAAGDVVLENANEGVDTVLSSVTFSLGAFANIENVTLTGTAALNATGNAIANTLVGNLGANNLTAAAGDDTLDGGAGIDTLVGGAGNDSYVVDAAGDVVVENANEGIDTVQSLNNFSLASLPNIENVTLLGTAALNATGNAFNNVLTGNGGNNLLDGGAGYDTMVGGKGDDVYFVDTETDVVVELNGEGNDTIQTSYSSYFFKLADFVENLTYVGSGYGILTGNQSNNVLTGGANDDRLDGGGGADTLIGGSGSDYYTIDDIGDIVIETTNAPSRDEVKIEGEFTSYTLGDNIEDLSYSGFNAFIGIGNELDNYLEGISSGASQTFYGGAGHDILNGRSGDDVLIGGAGFDFLIGGEGKDIFVFENGMDVDTISDFSPTLGDTIQLNAASFGLPDGANISNYLVINAGAPDASHGYFLALSREFYGGYPSAILWDADGSGAGEAVELATFNGPSIVMTTSNFVLA
jgi:Ca2+-binding RTX toxin-like protein